MLNRSIVSLGFALIAGPAFAWSDLTVSLTPPVGAKVYDVARYSVRVRNVGNKSASAVGLTIQLPASNTSPVVVPLATVIARDGRCTLSGTRILCTLGAMARNTTTNLDFDLRFPYSAAPLALAATVSTTSTENSTLNNSFQHTLALATYEVPVGATVEILNQHCTGHALTSFHECECFPSSISEHSAVLNHPDLTISFPLYGPEYGGSWSQPSPDRLIMEYTENGQPMAMFDGRGVSPNCFEGITTFIPDNGYMSVYRVCLQ